MNFYQLNEQIYNEWTWLTLANILGTPGGWTREEAAACKSLDDVSRRRVLELIKNKVAEYERFGQRRPKGILDQAVKQVQAEIGVRTGQGSQKLQSAQYWRPTG